MSEQPESTGAWTICWCGVVVADEVAHALFHATLTQTTKRVS